MKIISFKWNPIALFQNHFIIVLIIAALMGMTANNNRICRSHMHRIHPILPYSSLPTHLHPYRPPPLDMGIISTTLTAHHEKSEQFGLCFIATSVSATSLFPIIYSSELNTKNRRKKRAATLPGMCDGCASVHISSRNFIRFFPFFVQC